MDRFFDVNAIPYSILDACHLEGVDPEKTPIIPVSEVPAARIVVRGDQIATGPWKGPWITLVIMRTDPDDDRTVFPPDMYRFAV